MKIQIFGYTVIIMKTKIMNKATTKATDTRVQKAKQKIIDAVAEIREEHGKLTMYAVSKRSGVSINTVKKYKELLDEEE